MSNFSITAQILRRRLPRLAPLTKAEIIGVLRRAARIMRRKRQSTKAG